MKLNAKVSKSCLQKDNDRNAKRTNKMCGQCGRLHGCEFLVGTNSCFGCAKSVHMVRDCPQLRHQAKANAQSRRNPNAIAEPPKRNIFYALNGRKEKERSTHVVTGTLHPFSIPMYALLDPGSTLSFVTPLIAYKFDLLPEIFNEPFLVSTPIGDGIIAEGV